MTIPSYRGTLWQYRTVLIFLISPNTNIHAHASYTFNKLVSNMIMRITVESLQSLQWQQGFRRTMNCFGCIDKFCPENESIEAYLEQIYCISV